MSATSFHSDLRRPMPVGVRYGTCVRARVADPLGPMSHSEMRSLLALVVDE